MWNNADAIAQKACSRSSGSLKFARCGDDILVHFSDIFDSINVHEEIRSAHPEWSVSFISPITFIEVCYFTVDSHDIQRLICIENQSQLAAYQCTRGSSMCDSQIPLY